MNDVPLLVFTILGFLLLAIVALLLNDAGNRFAVNQLRIHQIRRFARRRRTAGAMKQATLNNLCLLVDSLTSSNQILLSRQEGLTQEVDGLREANFELQSDNERLGKEISKYDIADLFAASAEDAF